MRAVFRLVVIFGLLASGLYAQRGALVKQKSLSELTEQADRIVHVRVISAKVEPHPHYPNLSTVVITVHVDDTLKGPDSREFKFRQFIWDWRDKQDSAGYRKGRELLLFLNKVNEEGLTSPTGMEQGRLEVERSADGQSVVRPRTQMQAFLQGVDSTLAKRGKSVPKTVQAAMADPSRPIALSDIKSVVRGLVGARSTQ